MIQQPCLGRLGVRSEIKFALGSGMEGVINKPIQTLWKK